MVFEDNKIILLALGAGFDIGLFWLVCCLGDSGLLVLIFVLCYICGRVVSGFSAGDKKLGRMVAGF